MPVQTAPYQLWISAWLGELVFEMVGYLILKLEVKSRVICIDI